MTRPTDTAKNGLRRVVERLEARRMLSLAAESFSTQRPSIDSSAFGFEEEALGDFASPSAGFDGDEFFNDDPSSWELEDFPPWHDRDSANNGSSPWWDVEGMIDIDEPKRDYSGGGIDEEALTEPNADVGDGSFGDAAEVLAEPGSSHDVTEVYDLLASLNYRPDRFGEIRFGSHSASHRYGSPLASVATKGERDSNEEAWEDSLVDIALVDIALVDIDGESKALESYNDDSATKALAGDTFDMEERTESAARRFQMFELLTVDDPQGEGAEVQRHAAADHDADAMAVENGDVDQSGEANGGDVDKKQPAIGSERPAESSSNQVREFDAAKASGAEISNFIRNPSERVASEPLDATSDIALDRRHADESENRPTWYTSVFLIVVAGAFHALWLRLTRRPINPAIDCEFPTVASTMPSVGGQTQKRFGVLTDDARNAKLDPTRATPSLRTPEPFASFPCETTRGEGG